MITYIFEIIPWIAVFTLSLGYWAQVWRIHEHKEVRDLSIVSYSLLAVGFFIMAIKAYYDGSTIFFIKQVATFLPATIVIFQIIKHRDDHWHDSHNPHCHECKEELEIYWKYCSYCGANAPEIDLMPQYKEHLEKEKLKKKKSQ